MNWHGTEIVWWYQEYCLPGHLVRVSVFKWMFWCPYGCQQLPTRSSDYPEHQNNCFLQPQTDRTINMVCSNGKGISYYSRNFKEISHNLLGQKLNIYTDHKNLTCKNFNADCVLLWILILNYYSPYIDYTPGNKDIVADALSWLPINGNQDTTHESTHTTETMPELYDIKEIPEGTFPLSFNIIDCRQWEALLNRKTSMRNI